MSNARFLTPLSGFGRLTAVSETAVGLKTGRLEVVGADEAEEAAGGSLGDGGVATFVHRAVELLGVASGADDAELGGDAPLLGVAEPALDAYNHPSPTGTYDATSDYLTLSLSALL